MKQGIIAASVFAAVNLTGCVVVVHDDPDWESYHHEFTLDAEQVQTVRIDSDAGNVRIVGVDGLEQVEVKAEIKTIDRTVNPEKAISFEQSSDQIAIQASSFEAYGSGWNDPMRINMTIRLPSDIALNVKQGSGDLKIYNIDKELTVDDKSGSLKIDSIGGDVVVEDSSGNIEINHVKGTLTIEDGSGDMDLVDIKGPVAIEDGSGRIFLKQVESSVKVEDGSGDFIAKNIGGQITMDDGSGNIKIENAAGFTLLSDGSGEVELTGVQAL